MVDNTYFANITSQVSNSAYDIDIDENNLTNVLFQSFSDNIKLCVTIDNLGEQIFDIDISSYFFLRLNICSLQAHFDELKELLCNFSTPPAIIFLSETRLKTCPLVNIDLPGYTFTHYPSTTNAVGVGAYVANYLKFNPASSLSLKLQVCKELWFNVYYPESKLKYMFGIIDFHPRNDVSTFIEALDTKLQEFNHTSDKAYIFWDINID